MKSWKSFIPDNHCPHPLRQSIDNQNYILNSVKLFTTLQVTTTINSCEKTVPSTQVKSPVQIIGSAQSQFCMYTTALKSP